MITLLTVFVEVIEFTFRLVAVVLEAVFGLTAAAFGLFGVAAILSPIILLLIILG